MRKFLIAGLVVLLPTVALAQHRGAVRHGGGFHQGGGHWRNGHWVPFAIGGALLGGAIITNERCWRWVVDQWGYQRRIWVC